MVDTCHLLTSEHAAGVSMLDAMKLNEMSVLGDCMIATVPPLALRIYADQTAPCTVQPDGSTPFTISDIVFFSANNRITDPFERKLAWFFILHSRWIEIATPAEIAGGKLKYAEFQYGPAEEMGCDGQPFRILGFVSEMISSQYADATSAEQRITLLMPESDVVEYGIVIPHDYQGQVLQLWRFVVQPNVRQKE